MKYKIKLISISINAILVFTGLSAFALTACRSSDKNNLSTVSDTILDSSKATAGNLKVLSELNVKIKETSGLALLGNLLITHNDKGRSNQLMLLNTQNGSIEQTIDVINIENTDWEDLAINDEFLFIGDMGNNEGERKNLAIHLVAITDITKNISAVKSVGSINFYYPEQHEFDISKKHNYDCEAILYHNQQLYLFTKNRLDDKTNLYTLPAKPGNYAAKLIGSFEVGGRITGADISPDGKRIALVGYNKKSDCFLWTFDGFAGDNLFIGNSKKYILGQYVQLGQMEAIAFKGNTSLYISSEEIANVHARLYLFKLD
jgi:hypothetical protein